MALAINIFGEIGETLWGMGITPRDVQEQLDSDPSADLVHVNLDTPGGNIVAASAIITMLQRHPGKIIARIDGQAASAGAFIALGADVIEISSAGFIMAHEARQRRIEVGRAGDHEQKAKQLRSINDTMAGFLSARTGQTHDEALATLADETWHNANEALAAKLVDRVFDGKAAQAIVAQGRYEHTPSHLIAPSVGSRPQAQAPRNPRIDDMKALGDRLAKYLDCELDDVESTVRALQADNKANRAALATTTATLNEQNAALEAIQALESKRVTAQRADATVQALANDGYILIGDERDTLLRELYEGGNGEQADKVAASYRKGQPLVPMTRQTEGNAGGRVSVTANVDGVWEALPAPTRAALTPLATKHSRRAVLESNPALLPAGLKLADLEG